jgi:riboflavin kinase/FMN adenylyltransferase
VKVLHGLDSLDKLPAGNALAVGNFDGIHVGHKAILDVPLTRGSEATGVVVVTFEPHPMTVLRPTVAPPRLTNRDRRRALLESAGVTHLVELPADESVLGLSAQVFWETIRDRARPSLWVEGHDFRFGKGAAGTVETLRQWATGTGVEIAVIDPVDVTLPGLQVVPASSSLVRWLVSHGRMLEAAAVLGRSHDVVGIVEKGFQRGRELGFPTANLRVEDQLVPVDGVYAGTAFFGGERYPAAVSVGTNPTFDGAARTVEAYLLDFEGDLYGKEMRLSFDRWVRGQVRYRGVEALVEQMRRDVEEVRRAA